MTYTLSQQQVDEIKKTAETWCWADDPDLLVDDYAGSNVDDAFAGGERAGWTLAARNLLDMIGVEFTVPVD